MYSTSPVYEVEVAPHEGSGARTRLMLASGAAALILLGAVWHAAAPVCVFTAGLLVTWTLAAADGFLLRAAVVGYLARGALAVGFLLLTLIDVPSLQSLMTPPYEGFRFWIFALDSPSYHANAVHTLEAWREGTEFPVGTGLEYQVVTALVYRVLGAHPLNMVLLNALFGALAVISAYRIGHRLGGAFTARVAAVTVALWPSALIWSSQLLKDTICLWLILAMLDLAMRITEPPVDRDWPTARVVMRVAGLAVLFFLVGVFTHRFRHHVFLILGPAAAVLVVHPLVRRTPTRWWRGLAGLVVIGMMMLSVFVSRRVDLEAAFAPPHPEAGRVNRGVAFQLAGNVDAAEAEYRRALAIRHDYAPAWRNLASVALLRGDLKLAMSLLSPYVQREPGDEEAKQLLAALADPSFRPDWLAPRHDRNAPIIPRAVARERSPLRFTGPKSDIVTGNRIAWPHDRLALNLDQIRINFTMSGGYSNLDPDVRFATLLDVVRYLPRGLAHLFFAPYPWQWFDARGGTGAFKVVSMIEALLLYVLAVPLLLGFWRALRSGRVDVWYLLAFVAGTGMLLGLVVSNLGTFFRLRLEFLFPFFTVLGLGLAAFLPARLVRD